MAWAILLRARRWGSRLTGTRQYEKLFDTVLEQKDSHGLNIAGGHRKLRSGSPLDESEPSRTPYPTLQRQFKLHWNPRNKESFALAVNQAKSRTRVRWWRSCLKLFREWCASRSGLVDSAWVFPAANDAGLSVGAALLCAVGCGELHPTRLEHAYWGPEFSSRECEAAVLHEPRVTFRRTNGPVNEEVAEALSTGKVVGVCRGQWIRTGGRLETAVFLLIPVVLRIAIA